MANGGLCMSMIIFLVLSKTNKNEIPIFYHQISKIKAKTVDLRLQDVEEMKFGF
jgi:hypothetical protein